MKELKALKRERNLYAIASYSCLIPTILCALYPESLSKFSVVPFTQLNAAWFVIFFANSFLWISWMKVLREISRIEKEAVQK